MAQYAIQIEKEMSFQGVLERFSNVYTFDTGTLESFNDADIINRLVQLEKAVHGTKVSFKQGKSYGIAGPNLGNVMREIIDLSGTGAVAGSTIYPECAVMIAFTLPRSPILKRRRVGRKWLHVGQLPSLGSATDDVQKGIAQLPADVQNFYLTNYATPLVTEAWSGGATFASNTDPFTSPDVHNWLEHRQFHR